MDTKAFFQKLARRALGVNGLAPTAFTAEEHELARKLAAGEEEPVLIGWKKPIPAKLIPALAMESHDAPALRGGFIFRSAQPDGITCPHGSTNLFHCMDEQAQIEYVRRATAS